MSARGSANVQDSVWILQAFERRALPLPSPSRIEAWTIRAPSDRALLETVYEALKTASVARDLSLLGVDPGRVSEDHLKAVAGRVSGEIIDLVSPETLDNIRAAISRLLYDKVGGEPDPVVRFILLTQEPWRTYALALSGLPPEKIRFTGNLDRPIALGVERMMADHGNLLPRKEIIENFRKARAFLREEKKRVRLEAERERRMERDFQDWVRSLWGDREVRRELGLRPKEFEEWVEGGRIPVVLRIESIRNGRLRERRLYDPEAVLKITPETIARWRRNAVRRAGKSGQIPFGGRPPGRRKDQEPPFRPGRG